MKIVISEKMEDEVVEKIRRLGEVAYLPNDLFASLKDAGAIVTRSATKVNEELLSNAPLLKVVARAGVGLDTIDLPTCEKRGIKVINTPGASSNAVAELALAMMLSFSRSLPRADSTMKKKVWAKKELTGREIQGKTLGVVGFGRIGSMLALKARALGMEILYYDPRPKPSGIGKAVNLDELFSSSDFISLHVPLSPETKGLVNGPAFSKMKKTAVLVNTARGGLVDEEALYSALKEGKIAGACLDVYPEEPYEGKLCELDNVLLTPHIGGSTKEAQARIGEELVEQLKAHLK
jgi:D-3-phosphoglycerate dehydrogenase